MILQQNRISKLSNQKYVMNSFGEYIQWEHYKYDLRLLNANKISQR